MFNHALQDTDQKTIEENTTYKQPAPKPQSVAKQPKEKESAATTPVPKDTPSNPPSRFKVIPVSTAQSVFHRSSFAIT